jgi:hypothetical protein
MKAAIAAAAMLEEARKTRLSQLPSMMFGAIFTL